MNNKDIKVLGLIPARSGSKGIVRKNVKILNGKPLIYWASKALIESKEVNKCICSTDNQEIAEIVKKLGIEVPFIRPKHLAEDDTLIIDVILHALEFFSEKGINFSHVMLVQPTSPTVTHKDIDEAIKLVKNNRYNSVISVYEYDGVHPAIMYQKNSSGNFISIFPENTESPRQKFKKVYVRSGLFYLIDTENLIKTKVLYGNKISAIKVEQERAITIDTEKDFVAAEIYMESKDGL